MQHVSWRPNVTQGYRLDRAASFADSPDCERVPFQRVRMKFITTDAERALSCVGRRDGRKCAGRSRRPASARRARDINSRQFIMCSNIFTETMRSNRVSGANTFIYDVRTRRFVRPRALTSLSIYSRCEFESP